MVHLRPYVSRRLLLNGAVPGGRICLLEAELCTYSVITVIITDMAVNVALELNWYVAVRNRKLAVRTGVWNRPTFTRLFLL